MHNRKDHCMKIGTEVYRSYLKKESGTKKVTHVLCWLLRPLVCPWLLYNDPTFLKQS